MYHASREALLIRHAYDHPLMAMLDVEFGYFTFHGAAVQRDGQALLLLGTNGAGKTTTAINLVRDHGFTLMADNFVPCNGTFVAAFPGNPRLKVGAASAPGVEVSIEPAAARLVATVLLTHDRLGQRLATDAARCLLRGYVENERENHLDAKFFALLCSERGRSTGACCAAVVSQLATSPVVVYDWRRDALGDLVEFAR